MSGLFTVFKSNSSHPKGDVIFVHGLAGHPWATWHSQNQTDDTNIDFWPFWLGETLLDKEIDVNIWSFGYEAPGFKYFGQGMSRFDQASNLLESLKVKNIGDRPFIFVTHSLGGLIVKEVIRSAQNFPQYQDILQQTKGIVFLSTPHTGTHLNNLIQNIGFLTQLTVNIEELQEHSPQLRNLNEWYRQNVDKLEIQTKVFYETKSMNGILVVDEDSSNPGIRDVKPVAILEDHISIAKPKKNDLVYLSTIKFCEEVFISKIEKNKFQEITSQKINTLIQGNNISGENIGHTGVFQNNTIENVNISLESSGEIATKESTQLSKNIEVNKNQALIQANFFLPDNLPNGYVKRPDALNSLLEALVNHHNDMVGVVGATALHGLGGLGKTVLARAICEELEILNNFPDGILWATVGQDSDPVVNQREWINTLKGNVFAAFSIESGKVELKRLLQNKRMLLILDDIWQERDIQALQVGGDQCKILITTRDASQTSDAFLIHLEQMKQQESRDLLKWSSKDKIRNEGLLDEIAERLGYLPLALRIVGAILAKGIDWKDIIEALNQGDLQFVSYGQSSVFAAIDTSVQYLPKDQRERYYELVVFPKDEPLVETAVAQLWEKTANMKLRHTKKLMLDFFDRALIQTDNILHDLQYDYLQAVVSIEKQKIIHSTLAEVYNQLDLWSSLSPKKDNSYGQKRLAYHLAKAERWNDLHILLTDHYYLQNKIDKLGTAALLRDFLLLPNCSELHQMGAALKLGAHILDHYPNQLKNQIYGRSGKLFELHNILIQSKPCFELSSQTLTSPSGNSLSQVKGHTGGINSCDISSDGKKILSASIDGTLRIWNIKTGKTQFVLEGHTDHVRSCQFSPNGEKILSASADGTLRIWNANTGKIQLILEGHAEALRSCKFSCDGKLIVSTDDSGRIRIWDAMRGQTMRILRGTKSSVYDCAFNPNNQLVVTASDDCILQVWELKTGETLFILEGHTDPVRSCTFSPHGKYILSASGDRTLRLWNFSKKQTIRIFEGHLGAVTKCMFSKKGNLILSSAWDRTLRLWNTKDGKTTHIFKGHKGSVNCCAFSLNEESVLSGAWDCTLRLWDIQSEKTIQLFEGHLNYIRACAFSSDGRIALTGSDDGILKLWSVNNQKTIAFLKGHTDYIRECVFSSNSNYAVSASDDNTLRLWDIKEKQTLRIFRGHTDRVRSCKFIPNSKLIISASWDNTLRLWDINSGKTIRIFEGHANGVSSCALGMNGQLLLSTSEDCTVRLWNLKTGKTLKEFKEHTDFVRSCAFHPDGKYFISASVDGKLFLWNLESEKCFQLKGHTDYIRSCTFSPDGKYVLSASDDSSLRLWEVISRKEKARWLADGSLMCCAISPNQKVAIVGDSLSNLHFLKLFL